MDIVRLIHPTLGLCAQQVIMSGSNEAQIRDKWRYRYGKIFNLCEVVVEREQKDNKKVGGKPKKKVQNIRTGEVYESVSHAASELKLAAFTIRRHCEKKSESKYGIKRTKPFLVKWA